MVDNNFKEKKGIILLRMRMAFKRHFLFSLSPWLPDGVGIFKPKTPNWVNFGGPRHGKCPFRICILRPFGII
jgi:hypothetical protein